MKLPKKTIVLVVITLGLALVTLTGFLFKAQIQESYWLRKYESSSHEQKDQIILKLAEVGSEKSIPVIVDSTSELLESLHWLIMESNSGLYITFQYPRSVPMGWKPPEVEPINEEKLKKRMKSLKAIYNAHPKEVEGLLNSYLKDSRDSARAVAGCLLLKKSSELKKHVPKKHFFISKLTRL